MVMILGAAGILLAAGSVLAALYMLAQTEFAYVHAFDVLFTGLASGLGFLGLAFLLAELRAIRRQLKTADSAALSSVLSAQTQTLVEAVTASLAARPPLRPAPAEARPAAIHPRAEAAESAGEEAAAPGQVRRGLHINLGQRVRRSGAAVPSEEPAEASEPAESPDLPAPVPRVPLRPSAIPAPRTLTPVVTQAPDEDALVLRPLTAERPGSPPRRPAFSARRL